MEFNRSSRLQQMQQNPNGALFTQMQSNTVGAEINNTSINESDKQYLLAFLLSLLFGLFGVDRFYMGYIGTGLLKLITFGGFGVWYLIDVVTIFLNKKKTKNHKALANYEKNRHNAKVLLLFVAIIILVYGVLYASFFQQILKIVSITSVDANDTITADFKDKNDIAPTTNTTTSSNESVPPANSNVPSQNTNSTKNTASNTSNNSSVASPPAPAVTSISNSGFTVKVTNVIYNPQVLGDTPNSGMQYVRVDLSVHNDGSSGDTWNPGAFYYRIASGVEYEQAIVFGDNAPNKNLSITGRLVTVQITVEPGQTNEEWSLVFQIPQGEKGKLVWRDGMFDKNGAINGILNL